jgi:hypothetical protein
MTERYPAGPTVAGSGHRDASGLNVIGGGVRNEAQLELFEQVLNLVRQYAPSAAIAFSRTPEETFDAAARWVDIPGRATAS